MMEFECSPRHNSSGAPHFLSPTHRHPSPVEGFPSIRQIRRSLSRSPSKPQRYSLSATKPTNTSPTASPLSPSGLSQTCTIDAAADVAPKPKFTLRRTGPPRVPPRRTSPNSPLRRALSDNTNTANATPRLTRKFTADDGQENRDTVTHTADYAPPPAENRYEEPVKIDFLRPDKLLQPVLNEHVSPMKSSPLKRSDGVMNLEAANVNSPRSTKRRSLHGALAFGSDFNIFDQGFDGTTSDSAESVASRSSDEKEREPGSTFSSTWPALPANSPQRRPFGLRKSTLQQRTGQPRPRLAPEAAREATQSPALTRARSRISLDSALPLRSIDFTSPFRRNYVNEPPVLFQPPPTRQHQSAPKPHPLSHALTPSSSTSSIVDEHSQPSQMASSSEATAAASLQRIPGFSKSLPVGAPRPVDGSDQPSSQDSFATPAGYKAAKPIPQAFMSTGLISKRNRNLDMPPANLFASTAMPDTPSKKASHFVLATSPAPASALGQLAQPVHEFGSPSTPFNARTSKFSPEAFGKGINIFGSRVKAPELTRRGSFLSNDGDDVSSNNSPSHGLDGQSSNDELPPTPTKSTSASTQTRPQSKGKSNSLRSSLFGRRTSLGPETFASPAADERPLPLEPSMPTLNTSVEATGKQLPQTPQEAYTPPDPSSLSISAEQRPMTAFGGRSISGFPPATPTGPRESGFGVSVGIGQSNTSSGYFANDVDTSLTSRFGIITSTGIGEFSQVYRVQKPLATGLAISQPALGPIRSVWAVKKSRKPYTGYKDRQRKKREVEMLRKVQGSEHVVEFVDSWEAKNHLYIQTEFCENGNLKDFLSTAGFKGRLDDFRIWKILLEMCQGVKAIHDANMIHLDLKPANVFIDWEGVLKIGDFGMASDWPAPPGLEGEGDREYIGPEVLSGRFDKPADIFALGMIMLEIAGNIVLPDEGASWQRLRAGDLSDLPSLTWSSDNSLRRDDSGEPVEPMDGVSTETSRVSDFGDDDLSFLRPTAPRHKRSQDLSRPPNFMVDAADPEALQQVVQCMICPDPDARPMIDQMLAAGGVEWVARRRRAGASVYEGNWGPADDVLNHGQDVEMTDM